jgi:hypothetical protein
MRKIILIFLAAVLMAANCFAQNVLSDSSQFNDGTVNSRIVGGTLKVRQGLIFKQNGEVISEEEAISYFGLKGAKQYRHGMNEYRIGVNILSTAGLIGVNGLIADAENGFADLYDDDAPPMFMVALVLAIPCALSGTPFICAGNGKLHHLAKQYNNKLIFGESVPQK